MTFPADRRGLKCLSVETEEHRIAPSVAGYPRTLHNTIISRALGVTDFQCSDSLLMSRLMVKH